MLDGKACNVITNQKSSTSCNICRALPNQMNDLSALQNLNIQEEYYYLGLSSLHCRIRFMECILHIAYNLPFQKSYAKGEDKKLKAEQKKFIQDSLKSKLGILVDVVKQGYGTTNDGNTARRFFDAFKIVAEITGVDIELIKRFSTLLQVITCGLEINYDKFETYATDTAKLFISLYSWYKMPPTVHKVLIHGRKIIEVFGLHIGCLSEEAQEANNKIFKQARAHHSRLFSRKANNEDVMNFMLISSDPVISSLRIIQKSKIKELSDEAKSLTYLSNYEEHDEGDIESGDE